MPFKMPFNMLLSGQFMVSELLLRGILLGIALSQFIAPKPFIRIVHLSEWDQYDFPLRQQSFSTVVTVAICAGALVSTFLLWAVILRVFRKWRLQQILYETILAFFSSSLAVLLTLILMNFMKVYYGEPRPNFLAQCFGKTPRPPFMPDIPHCAYEEANIKGRMSFPSGHSANVWTTFLWIALYFYTKISLFRGTAGWRIGIPVGILVFPLAVSISRTRDYYHFPVDVVSGAILGVLITFPVFIFYHPICTLPVDSLITDFYKPPAVINSLLDDAEDYEEETSLEQV